MNKRVTWKTYFMNIAKEVSTRSTCDRKHVGAVIVREKTILSTGYNGSIKGLPHCDTVGCEMVDGHCVRTTHAEANAILKTASSVNSCNGGTLYLTMSPCKECSKLVHQSGIIRLVYLKKYSDTSGINFLKDAGVDIVEFDENKL